MANGVFQATVINERTGKPCALARVTVLTAGNALANLFADRAGTRTMKNPMITDLQGFVRCYAVAGTYTIKTDHDLGSQTLTGVQFIDVASGAAKELLDTKILQSETGLPAPFAKVTVLTSAGAEADIFDAENESVPIANPIVADEFGVIRCKLIADRYDLLAEFHTGATRLFKDVVMPTYVLGGGGAGGSPGGGGGGGTTYFITPYNGWYSDGGSYFPAPIDSSGATTTGIHDNGEASENWVRGSRQAAMTPGLPPGITYWQFGYADFSGTILCFLQLVGATGTEVFTLSGDGTLENMSSSSATFYSSYSGAGLEDGDVWVWDFTGTYTSTDIDFTETDMVSLTIE